MLAKVVLLFIFIFTCNHAEAKPCHCRSPDQCSPIAVDQNGFEFVGFSLSQDPSIYKRYDWTKLTTIVILTVGNQTKDLACFAHSKNARITLLTTTTNAVLENSTLRESFVTESVQKVVDYGLDGINIDFEGSVSVNSSAYNGLTDLMQELRVTLKKSNSAYSLSMDYVYCPECVNGRTYNYRVIQNYIDYFIIMNYDMQGQTDNRNNPLCFSLVNAPYWAIYDYTAKFLRNGVPREKLVMAFPWYGYKTVCYEFDKISQTCYIPCDKKSQGNSQVCYASIMDYLHKFSTDGRRWNPKTLTPFFAYNDQGTLYQMNYDDPWSLHQKFQMALYFGVRGSGTWQLNCLDYSDDPERVTDRGFMWSIIPTGM